jgi:hypothetical protein
MNFVRKEILRRLQASQVATILVEQAQNRILNSGADIGGYAPLWANNAKIKVRKGNKMVKVPHYRAGGTPLYDTGSMFQSLHAKLDSITDGVRMTLLGSAIAVLQHRGFSTTGPNYIPFDRAGVRGEWKDSKKKKKKKKKSRGGSYVINDPPGLVVAKGVTVPSRPILAMPSSAKQEVAIAIAHALGAR